MYSLLVCMLFGLFTKYVIPHDGINPLLNVLYFVFYDFWSHDPYSLSNWLHQCCITVLMKTQSWKRIGILINVKQRLCAPDFIHFFHYKSVILLKAELYCGSTEFSTSDEMNGKMIVTSQSVLHVLCNKDNSFVGLSVLCCVYTWA